MRIIGRVLLISSVLTFGVVAAEPTPAVPDGADIRVLMKKTFMTPGNRGTNKNLDSKLILGKATEAEQQELLRLLDQLANTKPRRGDLEAWQTRTRELQDSAKAVIKGEANAVARFKKASSCRDCHRLHRPER